MTHVAWPEIESFHNIRKYAKEHPEICNGDMNISYRGKVKLHGTNAAVQLLKTDEVVAQSRTTILTPHSDNAGFAKWVADNERAWRAARPTDAEIIVFGEWCGPGIQKGVAVNEIHKRVFAVFAVYSITSNHLTVDPKNIIDLIGVNVPDVYVLPWATDPILVDWAASAEVLQPIVDKINGFVAEVERCDPWVKKTFSVEGLGEGLVFYPRPCENRETFANLVFKAKGEKHKVVASKSPAQIDPEAAASADAFAKMVLTEARLEQGVESVGGLDTKNTGKFLEWIVKDVMKETTDELVASNLEWKQVSRPISDTARKWYIGKCKNI